MSRIVATYMYTDERGRPVLRKVRSDPKRFKMQAARYTNSRLYWRGDPGCVERWQPEWADKAMYNLPVLLDALRLGRRVYLVEGEKDCDVMTALHTVPATTNWQGAGEFTHQQAKWFTTYGNRSKIRIVMDSDGPGRWAGWQRYRLLVAVGVDPKRIRLVTPDAGKDVADMALCGLGLDALVRVPRREVRLAAEAYGAERAARYSFPAPVDKGV